VMWSRWCVHQTVNPQDRPSPPHMGFPITHVLTSKEKVSQFTCKICNQLAKNAFVTSCCNDLYCNACLEDWLAETPHCSTCNRDLGHDDVVDLKTANPPKFRILSQVQCQCPIDGCAWKGDYSELSSHLSSSESHTASPAATAASQATHLRAQADALNEQGNEQVKQRAWVDAVTFYTTAIDLVPNVATYYGNRAAARLVLNDPKECISDCKRAVALDPKYIKGYAWLAQGHMACGEFDKAAAALDQGLAAVPGNEELLERHCKISQVMQSEQRAQAAYQAEDFRSAIALWDSIIRYANVPSLNLWAARAEVRIGMSDRALCRSLRVITMDPQNSDAHAVCGMALLLGKQIDQALKYFMEALRLNPDDGDVARTCKKARKLKGLLQDAKVVMERRCSRRKADRHQKFQEAFDLYTEALALVEAPTRAPISALLHAHLAECLLGLDRCEDCIAECCIVIDAEDDNLDAWLTKVKALHKLKRHYEALVDIQRLRQHDLHRKNSKVQAAYEKTWVRAQAALDNTDDEEERLRKRSKFIDDECKTTYH